MTDSILHNMNWWPHRYELNRDEVHYIKADREAHRAAIFLTDEYLKGAQSPRAIKRDMAVAAADTAPLHFIFHSAYCCSTLLARAFDIPGTSMGFKEPVILNDIIGCKARGTSAHDIHHILDDTLTLLARPFEKGETLIVKPSSLINVLAPDIIRLRPDAKILFLYAPLKDFLGSIARKGMWGRLWVRELMSKQLHGGMIDLGLNGDDYIRLTDLQAAAVCWLAQQSLFASLKRGLGNSRALTLDSATLMRAPESILQQLSEHFNLNLDAQTIKTIVNGPVFQSHSKTNINFDRESRELDRSSGQELYRDEIEKVYVWAKIVGENVGIPLIIPQ